VNVQAMTAPAASPDGQDEAHPRLHGRALFFVRLAWVAVTLLAIGLFIASLPSAFQYLHTVCTAAKCAEGQLTPQRVQALRYLGLSVDFYASYLVGIAIVVAATFLAIATVIFMRRSDDRLALLGALTLAVFGLVTFPEITAPLQADQPILWLPVQLVTAVGSISFLIFFYVFPDGRFVPRWTRWLALLWIVREALRYLFPNSPFDPGTWPEPIGSLTFLGFLVSVLFVQVYRYRRVSGPLQRQQTKWVVFGVTVALGGFILVGLASGNVTFLTQNVLGSLIAITAQALFILLIPLSIGIAILRHRLLDIDILINRTLVYVPLTGILAGLFAASIVLSQKLFIALTGQQSDAATVLTTLIVVAAFDPIKNGLQHLVDQRFKEAPDPSKELKVLGEQMRLVLQVIDIEQITRRVLEKATLAFDARSGAVYLEEDGKLKMSHTTGEWNGEAKLSVPLQSNGVQLGRVALGARRNGMDYTSQDRETFQEIVDLMARAIALAGYVK
jgi:hypothetical protein